MSDSGAPADFAGRVLSNPNGVKPKLDTDAPDTDRISGGAKFNIDNPPAADVAPKPHPIDAHTQKPTSVRHPLGRGIPAGHPAISDN